MPRKVFVNSILWFYGILFVPGFVLSEWFAGLEMLIIPLSDNDFARAEKARCLHPRGIVFSFAFLICISPITLLISITHPVRTYPH